MKTAPEHRTNEVTKRLFRELFEIQFQLERYNRIENDPEITMVIDRLDRILERILSVYDG